jgi:hypothetical protein
VAFHAHEAFLCQKYQCLTHRAAANVQTGRHFFLDQPLPKIDLTSEYCIANCIGDLVRQDTSARWTDHGAVNLKIGHVSLSKTTELTRRHRL